MGYMDPDPEEDWSNYRYYVAPPKDDKGNPTLPVWSPVPYQPITTQQPETTIGGVNISRWKWWIVGGIVVYFLLMD